MKTWAELLALEPSLCQIDDLLARLKQSKTDDNGWKLYSEAKAEIERRVGWYALSPRSPVLLTSESYDTACRHVIDQLGI